LNRFLRVEEYKMLPRLSPPIAPSAVLFHQVLIARALQL
jgi:hypothetical protein